MYSNNVFTISGNDIIIINGKRKATCNFWYTSFRAVLRKITTGADFTRKDISQAKHAFQNITLPPTAIEMTVTVNSKEAFTAHEFFHGISDATNIILNKYGHPSVFYYFTDSVKKSNIFGKLLQRWNYEPWFTIQDMYFFKKG